MSPQLLLFAEPLVATGLSRLVAEHFDDLAVVEQPERLKGAPALVIWRPSHGIRAPELRREALLLRERWRPAPLLLLLPPAHGLPAASLLELPAHGLLEAPGTAELVEAVRTLRAGGRVLQLRTRTEPATGPEPRHPLGFGQQLLISGLEQIDATTALCERLLDPPPPQGPRRWLLEGRLRELACARQLLLLLWGPLSLAWDLPDAQAAPASSSASAVAEASGDRALALTLQQRNAAGIWRAVRERLEGAIATGLSNGSGQLMALEGLNPERCHDLLHALLHQLETLRDQLAAEPEAAQALLPRWQAAQPQLREEALRSMASPYVQIPRQGLLAPVASSLVSASNLAVVDPELPDLQPMLATLVLARPLLVNGQLLPADELQAMVHLERLVANWLVRTAELLAADVLACCGDWPELRRYLLREELLSTRQLERLRNQLNAQQRWRDWFERPVAIYESRRQLLCVEGGSITRLDLLEPRDAELQRLAPLQQLVTLALEARDAVSPQLRQLIQSLGRLVVVLLTEVVGRAIGLVGRGIVQGMGRRSGRST